MLRAVKIVKTDFLDSNFYKPIFGNPVKRMGKYQGLFFEESRKYFEQSCLK